MSTQISPENIGKAYDRITDRWTSDTFNRANGIEQHRRAFAFLNDKHTALDVGCGCTGRLTDLMLEQGLAVECVDVSARMLELARERHPEVSFQQADICSWESEASYDFITAWDSIWHVPLTEHEGVVRKLLNSLQPGGVCIFSFGGVDTPGEKVDRAMGVEMYYSTLGIPRTLEVIADCDCICKHLEFDQYPELHAYVIVQRAGGTANT